MAAYNYACEDCGEMVEKTAPIGTAQRMMSCPECGATARLLIGVGVHISAHATPTKGGTVIEADAREERWNADMPAYYRMRKKGMQPPTVDGAAALEGRVADQHDIDRDHIARSVDGPVSRERFLEAQEQAQDLRYAALDNG